MAEAASADMLGDDGEALPEPKRFSGKKIVLFGGAGLLLLLLLIGGGFALGLFGGHEEAKPSAEDAHAAQLANEPIEVIFYDVPEMLVNLNTGERKASYLKIKIALEVDRQSAAKALEEKLPRVMDNFQVYLRELRVEDLAGSAGMFRLKEELLRRVNKAVEPTQVKDVLFKEMLVQ